MNWKQKLFMKKIILTTAIFITVTNFAFSQDEEENEIIKPPSKVGGMLCGVATVIGLAEYVGGFYGYGGEIYYQKYFTQKVFLSLGAAYLPKFTTWNLSDDSETDILHTFYLGLNFHREGKKLINYWGVEAHFLTYKENISIYDPEEKTTTKFTNPTTVMVPLFVLGTSHKLSKNLSLDINTRLLLIWPTGINIGVSYLLPAKEK